MTIHMQWKVGPAIDGPLPPRRRTPVIPCHYVGHVTDLTSGPLANAPLIEIDVELHWSAPDESPEASVVFDGTSSGAADEPFFNMLGKRLAEFGFTQVDRMYPPGFRLSPSIATRRFLNPSDVESSVSYQAGAAVFTVNAIPPYRSWSEFRPAVQRGIDALLSSFPEGERPSELTRVELTYIDAFKEEHQGGKTRDELFETLGFGIKLPEALSRILVDGRVGNPFIQFEGDLPDGKDLLVKSGLATVSNAPAVVLDTLISHNQPVELATDEILRVLDSSQALMHDSFFGMTHPIVDVLRGSSR